MFSRCPGNSMTTRNHRHNHGEKKDVKLVIKKDNRETEKEGFILKHSSCFKMTSNNMKSLAVNTHSI